MSKDLSMAKVFFEEEVAGETVLKNYTTTAASLPFSLRVKPGAGGKFWSWPTVSNVANIIACDFTDAPTASDSPAANLAALNSITAIPADVLVWS